MYGQESLVNIHTPRTRVITTATHTFVGLADDPSRPLNSVGWAWKRIVTATGDVDWALKDGIPTMDHVFTGIGGDTLIYDYS